MVCDPCSKHTWYMGSLNQIKISFNLKIKSQNKECQNLMWLSAVRFFTRFCNFTRFGLCVYVHVYTLQPILEDLCPPQTGNHWWFHNPLPPFILTLVDVNYGGIDLVGIRSLQDKSKTIRNIHSIVYLWHRIVLEALHQAHLEYHFERAVSCFSAIGPSIKQGGS